MKFVIIGSGPTALGSAYRLNELITDGVLPPTTQVLVLEKENVVGGLARSETDEHGFTWDLGVHVSGASKYPKYTAVINEAVKEWNNVPRSVKAFMRHVIEDDDVRKNYVPYPVQGSIPHFRPEIKDKCLHELENLPELKSSTWNNFGQFTALTFGDTLQKVFIRPYNEKVWTVKLEEMNTTWAENRVPRTDLNDLKRKCSLTAEELAIEDAKKVKVLFRYPRSLKGVGEVWKRVASWLPPKWIRFNTEVTSIDTENKIIRTKSGLPITYDVIISTIPIVTLGKITNILPEINLQHSTVLLVGIGMRRPQPLFTHNLSWVYFPLQDSVFYRCTFISNFNEHMTPDHNRFWSVIVEIGVKAGSEINIDEYVERTINDLHSHGLMDDPTSVVSKWTHLLPFGYPIPTLERDQVLAESHKVFHENCIFSRGRFGGWKYEAANQDHSFILGNQVVDRILFDTPEVLF